MFQRCPNCDMHPGLDCQVCNNCRIIDTVTGRPPSKELVDFKKADEVDNTIHILSQKMNVSSDHITALLLGESHFKYPVVIANLPIGMNLAIDPTEYLYDNQIRASGNTTRLIDFCIQLLFMGYEIFVKDFHKSSPERDTLLERILNRLDKEHFIKDVDDMNRGRIFILNKGGRQWTLKLS